MTEELFKRLIQAIEIFVWFKTGINPRCEDIKDGKRVEREDE